jgi:hypothetical protein
MAALDNIKDKVGSIRDSMVSPSNGGVSSNTTSVVGDLSPTTGNVGDSANSVPTDSPNAPQVPEVPEVPKLPKLPKIPLPSLVPLPKFRKKKPEENPKKKKNFMRGLEIINASSGIKPIGQAKSTFGAISEGLLKAEKGFIATDLAKLKAINNLKSNKIKAGQKILLN